MSVTLQTGIRQKNKGTSRHILAALLVSLIVFVTICAAGAQFLVQSGASGSMASPVSLAAILIAALCEGWLTARMQGHGALLCASAAFLLYGVFPAAVGILWGNGEDVLFLGIRVGAVLLASVLGALSGIHSHGKRKQVI